VSRRSNRERDAGAERDLGAIPSQRPGLRRGLFGYRREDVDQALEARDTELAEMRQDVAALWLAFAQHDRLIRSVVEGRSSSPQPRPAAPAAPPPRPVAPEPAPAPPPAPVPSQAPVAADPTAAEATAPISRQLEELDQVLAAIESATQTLERTYVDEAGKPAEADRGSSAESH
jgi:hypothetical protein